MITIKRTNLVLTAFVAALVAVLICSALFVGSAERFTSKPSHCIITKWYNSKERRIKPADTEITKSITLHACAEQSFDGKRIIIKAENLSVSVYTKGKFLYTEKADGKALAGERILLINADGVKKNSTVYIRLTPIKNGAGKINAPIYVADNNDFLFTLLNREKGALIATAALLEGVLLCALCAAYMIIAKRKKYAFVIYPGVVFFLAAVHIFSGSDLFQFLSSSGESRHILVNASYMLLPAPVLAFAVGLTKRSKTVSVIQICITAYTVLRILLFELFGLFMDKGIIISHMLLISAVIVSLLMFLNRGTRQYKGRGESPSVN